MFTVVLDDWIVCNCALCGRLLLGRAMVGRVHFPASEYVSGRVNDRPYCHKCYPTMLVEAKPRHQMAAQH